MKLVIDISEEDYNNIEPFLNGQTIKGGFNLFKVLEIIKDGIPLKDEVVLATLLSLVADKDYKPKLEGEQE